MAGPSARATIPLTHVDDGYDKTIVGAVQVQSNCVNLPLGSAPGDVAVIEGISDNTISAGPAGWTQNVNPSQVATTPGIVWRGMWWKKLTAADLLAQPFCFTTTGLNSVAQFMVARGPNGVRTQQVAVWNSKTTQALTGITKGASSTLLALFVALDPRLVETVNLDRIPPFTQAFPGVTFAGNLWFVAPASYTNGLLITPSWTTLSGGAYVFVDFN